MWRFFRLLHHQGAVGPTGLQQGLSVPGHTSAHCPNVTDGISATQLQKEGLDSVCVLSSDKLNKSVSGKAFDCHFISAGEKEIITGDGGIQFKHFAEFQYCVTTYFAPRAFLCCAVRATASTRVIRRCFHFENEKIKSLS